MRHLNLIIIAVVMIAVASIIVFVPQNKVLTIGDTVSEFRLGDLQGNDFFSNRHQGQVLLVNFWATWCTYCIEELPFIESLNQKYAAKGLQTISVLKDANNIDLAFEISHKNGLTYPVLLDKDEILFKTFGVTSLPNTVLIDRQGKIRFIHLGYNPKDAPKFEKEINQLLEEK